MTCCLLAVPHSHYHTWPRHADRGDGQPWTDLTVPGSAESECPVSTSITKRIKNLLKGLGLQGRISLFVNSEPYFWILFQKLCIALLRNKSERAPNLIIMSRKASENGDHHSLTIDIWYLVTWKAIETRWNIVTRPKIEVSRSMLPFFRGDLPTSQALGKNQED